LSRNPSRVVVSSGANISLAPSSGGGACSPNASALGRKLVSNVKSKSAKEAGGAGGGCMGGGGGRSMVKKMRRWAKVQDAGIEPNGAIRLATAT